MTTMTAFRTLLAAAALVGASAFAAPLSVVNQGENFSVQYEAGYTGNIVGGGESQEITYGDSRFAPHAAGIPAFTGGSEGDVAYVPLAISATQMAAR
jgi:hypothetical protein